MPQTDPDYARVTAEEAFAALMEVPDIRLVRCLVIADDVHKEEPWRRQTDPEWHVFGETFAGGEIRLYRPTAADDVSETLKHEWAHLLELAERNWQHTFEQVRDLEPFFTGDATLDSVDGAEQWAYFGARLLSTAPLLSPATISANPIRASIWTGALAQRLCSLPAGQRSASHQFYECVVKWAKDEARPVALKRLTSATTDGDVEHARRAQLILDMLKSV
jgi:hypothetical protein